MNPKRRDSSKSRPLGPPPPPSSETVSRVMKANVSSNTSPEVTMRGALHKMGLSGYRLNWEGAPGSPDIAYPGRRVAIFVHGCFWHRHFHSRARLPKTHSDFWRRKFERNVARDRMKTVALKRLGWKVFVFWECQVKRNPARLASKVRDYVNGRP